MIIGVAVGAVAAIGCVIAVVVIIVKVKAKLAAGVASAGASAATSGGGQIPISGVGNSIAPASSYEPLLDGVEIPDAPQPYGYQGPGGLGGPAEYTPPTHLPPLSNAPQPVPQFTGYMMAGQEPPLPNTLGAAEYQVPDIVAPAVYNLWLWTETFVFIFNCAFDIHWKHVLFGCRLTLNGKLYFWLIVS